MRTYSFMSLIVASGLFVIAFPGCPTQTPPPAMPASSELPSPDEREINCPIQIETEEPAPGPLGITQPFDGTGSRSTPHVSFERRFIIITTRAGKRDPQQSESQRPTIQGRRLILLRGPRVQSVHHQPPAP